MPQPPTEEQRQHSLKMKRLADRYIAANRKRWARLQAMRAAHLAKCYAPAVTAAV
jgi:hypothetical protein